MNGRTKQKLIPVSLAVTIIILAITGGVTWGQTERRITDAETRIETVEEDVDGIEEKLNRVTTNQAVIDERIKRVYDEQKRSNDVLKLILREVQEAQ